MIQDSLFLHGEGHVGAHDDRNTPWSTAAFLVQVSFGLLLDISEVEMFEVSLLLLHLLNGLPEQLVHLQVRQLLARVLTEGVVERSDLEQLVRQRKDVALMTG